MQPQCAGPPQRGLLVRHSGGCMSPRVLDFLCFDTPRSVLGSKEGEEDLTFYLVDQETLEDHVHQGLLPCPALWVEQSTLAVGSGPLRLLYRLGGALQLCELPCKPLKLQPVKQGLSSSGTGAGGNACQQGSSSSRGRTSPACRAFVSSRRHMQLYRLVVSLFPKLKQLDQELRSGVVALRGPQSASVAAGLVAPGLQADTATPIPQGVLLERLDDSGEPCQITIAIDFEHVCLVLREAPGPGCTPDCLRTINSLTEALAVLHHETGRLGPSLTASPAKPATAGRGAAATVLQSPAKPPLPAAHGTEALRLAVGLLQECGSAQLREGLAILSAAAASPQLCGVALGFGAMEALVTAAATVLPTTSMGMVELQPSIAVAINGLLDAAPPAAFAAGRLVSILAAVLQQSCANPLLLCRLLVSLLQRADVRAEAMRQGLSGAIVDMYARMPPIAAAAAANAAGRSPGQNMSSRCQHRQQPTQQQQGFGSPLGLATAGENLAAVSNGKQSQVASLVAAYNALSDSGSDCSPSVSICASPVKGSPMRSPSALSSSRFSVPRLALPTCESPTAAAAGLTRSTRRVLSGTPGGTRSPSPYASPTRRSGTCDTGEPVAAAELATLASALGESLMAADLPAIVAHKRMADARLGEAEEDGMPAELLEAPTTGAAPGVGRKVLEAHRILVTARSLRSVDSSPTRISETGSEADAAAVVHSTWLPLDVDQIKCLLLKAVTAVLPMLEATDWPANDPSPILAAEVLSLLGKPLSAAQEQFKGLALAALIRLSQRPAAAGAGAAALQHGAAAASASRCEHVLVALAGQRLEALMGSGPLKGEARAELLTLLQLLTDYATAVERASVSEALVRDCLHGLQSLMGVLQASGLDPAAWAPPAWQLLHSLVLLLAAVCKKCEDAEAGRGLLALLLADQQVAAMLAGAASHMLLLPEQPQHGTSFVQRSRATALQRDLLQLLVALAGLVGRQPPCVPQLHHPGESDRAASRLRVASSALDNLGTSRAGQPGPGQDLLLGLDVRHGLTRRHALQFFGFLVSPHSGLAQRILDHDPAAAGPAGVAAAAAAVRGAAKQHEQQQQQASALAPGVPTLPANNVRLRQGLLELLKAVFAASGSPFASDKFVSDFYIRFHFVQLLKLYHNPHRDHQALFLCRQHMDVLLVLAANKSSHIRHRFRQLSVVDFFMRELSLEFEAKQPARGRMHRLSSSDSQLEHRRTSSCSTVGGFESRIASPVPSLRLPNVHEPEKERGLPAGVPLLPLPSHGGAAGGDGGSGSSSPALQLPPGIGRGGSRGTVPRLNLGFGPSLPSPRGQSTPSPGNSARHGRPPLPPSARSGMGATPRLTSRLGRTMSARSGDMSAAAAAAAAAATQQAGAVPRTSSSGGLGLAAGSAPAGKLGIPKLGLMGFDCSLTPPGGAAAGLAAAGAAAPPAAPDTRSNSRVHFSTLPSDDENDSDTDRSSDGRVGGGGATDAATCARPTPDLGFDVPAGFTFTGDLEEDLERLEALEDRHTDAESEESECEGPDSETASPTIPALRNSPFQTSSTSRPLLAVPRFKAPLPPAGDAQAPGSGGRAVPRLNLATSMHSNLEGRNASAELQLAADAEQAKARPGCSVLGELERSALGKGKMQAASLRKLHSSLSDITGLSATDVSYSEERGRRLLYRDEGLHLEVLQLVFTLLIDEAGQLDATYCDQYPWERKLQNIPFILYHHLNHEDNCPLLPHLLPRLASGTSVGSPELRLLRVLCAAFFRPEWYTGRTRISSAVGAYSTVYRASLPVWAGDGTVVLKMVDTPKHIQDRCAQVDVQGEVSILQALAGSPRACQLYDYGVDPAAEAMFLVLKDYRCSLKQWRVRQPSAPAGQLRLYYVLFSEVVAAVASLLERGIVHFDLKCDNCLLEPLPGVSEAEFWSPSSERLPFRVVLADFGESKAFGEDADAAITVRARGTDCFKSPEMLLVGGTSYKEQRFYDRRRRQGAGPASDIWSLGCLLFELVTGKLLFSDSDWLQLLARVTSPSMPLITEERAALVAGLPGMLDLLQYMLVRDARMRPTLADLHARLAAIRSSSHVQLPPHVRVTTPPLSSRGSHLGLLRSEGSQISSPTGYAPSPKAAMPMPLLAALPLSRQLVLAPLALLSGTAALKQHPARRVVLLFSLASSCHSGLQAGIRSGNGGGGLSPASSPGSRSTSSSRSGSPPPADACRYNGANHQLSCTYTFSTNPGFSPTGIDLLSGGGRTPPRTLTGTPRTALQFGGAAVHPEIEDSEAEVAAVSAATSPGGSPTRPRVGTSRVHPELSLMQQQEPRGLQLILPALPVAAAASLGSSRGVGDAALLTRVLADCELAAAAGSCTATGVECQLALACPTGRESRMQQSLALAEWLTATALPLLNGGGGCGRPQPLPVLLAVQAGSEAEGAMAAVAHLMQYCQVSLYQAMVAVSQWGIDLHLRPHHLLALQHWAATDGPTVTLSSRAARSSGGGTTAVPAGSSSWC